ncbi:uncharacterized protein METZ01_LOCUS400601, partial [marine metagenome]
EEAARTRVKDQRKLLARAKKDSEQDSFY